MLENNSPDSDIWEKFWWEASTGLQQTSFVKIIFFPNSSKFEVELDS